MPLMQKDIQKIGRLARIKVLPGEEDTIATQLNAIFQWMEDLQKVDVSAVNLLENFTTPQMLERADVVTEVSQVDAILANAPAASHHMFSVPKVVE
jgi:aspartyl-tRNA(Asn)/glutamyl-tRNA(Gln) amidotransferase subunit C